MNKKKHFSGVIHNTNENSYIVMIYYITQSTQYYMFLIVVVLYPADGDDERDGDVEIGGEHDDVGTVIGEH